MLRSWRLLSTGPSARAERRGPVRVRQTSRQRPSYEPGDYVCPADLAGPIVCRIIEVIELRGGVARLLALAVIGRPGTSLVRTDRQVWPVRPRLLWQTCTMAGQDAA